MDSFHNERIVEEQMRKYGADRNESYFYLDKC